MLDMRVFEISSTLARQVGTAWPTQFTMFNINPSLLAGLGQNAQNLINQLIASGGINQANSTAIQALLAQLANQSSSILSQPFATFGGGLTLFGLTSGGTGVTINLSVNDSNLRNLEHVTLRASQNNAATLKIGERYPLVNATFSPIYNTPAIAQVIGNSSYIAPFPSFYFEDLGLILKATPLIHGDRDITLNLELAIRSLGTQTVNGMPIINNQEYNGIITVKDGESSVVTGLLSRADALSLTGYPFLSRVPGLTYASSEHNTNGMDDELLVVITPHIVRLPERSPFAMSLPSAQ
jgi:general secretion pathway protein D